MSDFISLCSLQRLVYLVGFVEVQIFYVFLCRFYSFVYSCPRSFIRHDLISIMKMIVLVEIPAVIYILLLLPALRQLMRYVWCCTCRKGKLR